MSPAAYGLTGISPLGTYGLGAGTGFGDYSSYMPSSYGMYSGYGMNGLGMGSMYGMSGMGSLFDYQRQMMQAQQQMETSQLNHAAQMHTGMVNNEVSAHEDTFSGIVRKLMTDGDIQQRIYSLNRKVEEGDQDGICQEYDKLKDRVYSECAKEFKGKGEFGNRADTANQIIDTIYSRLISARKGDTRNLHDDIVKYGDGAFQNGLLNGFRSDHHNKFVDETINHIYGERIDHRGEKDMRKTLGTGIGRVASVLEKTAIGGAVGAGTYAAGVGAAALIGCAFGKGGAILKAFKYLPQVAGVAAIAGGVFDICRQIFGSSKSGSASKAAA